MSVNKKAKNKKIGVSEQCSRVAVRFFIRRSKRINSLLKFVCNQKPGQENSNSNSDKDVKHEEPKPVEKSSMTECLHYLGLSSTRANVIVTPSPMRKVPTFGSTNKSHGTFSRADRLNKYETTFLSLRRVSDHQSSDEALFKEPKIFRCEYCPKVFFHRATWRKHVLRHIRTLKRCNRCKCAFKTLLAKKKHQLNCRKSLS